MMYRRSAATLMAILLLSACAVTEQAEVKTEADAAESDAAAQNETSDAAALEESYVGIGSLDPEPVPTVAADAPRYVRVQLVPVTRTVATVPANARRTGPAMPLPVPRPSLSSQSPALVPDAVSRRVALSGMRPSEYSSLIAASQVSTVRRSRAAKAKPATEFGPIPIQPH